MSDKIVEITDQGYASDSIGGIDAQAEVSDSGTFTDEVVLTYVTKTDIDLTDSGVFTDDDPFIGVDVSLSDQNVRLAEDISILVRNRLTEKAYGHDRVSVYKYKSIVNVRRLIPDRILHDHESREG